MAVPNNVAVIGGGNLGNSIARGLISAGLIPASGLAVTRRRPELLAELAEAGVAEFAFLPVGVGSDAQASVQRTWEVLSELTGDLNASTA